MMVIVYLTVVPFGVGFSLSKFVVGWLVVLNRRGLKTALHANGTNIEGEWDEVFAAVKECHEKVHEMGAPRIHTNIKLGTRNDREQSLQDKVQSVEQKLA
jgi:uncharacterized protein (TIGR00106 family)